MPANVYHFVTPWFVAGATIDDVWPLVSDAATFPQWWSTVFLGVEREAAGDPATGLCRWLSAAGVPAERQPLDRPEAWPQPLAAEALVVWPDLQAPEATAEALVAQAVTDRTAVG